MSNELNPTGEREQSWVYRLPSQLACFLLAICLITSQWNPCDATSVSMGSSLTFILLAIAIGFLVSIDVVLNRLEQTANKQFRWLVVAFVLFGLWLCICTAIVPGRGNARFAINGCWQWIAEWILTLSVAVLCLRHSVGVAVTALMLGCAAGTVASVCHQYFIGMPALRTMFAADPNAFFEKMGVVEGSSDAMQLASRLGSLEPTGPFALTNSLAGLMATWLVFVTVKLLGQSSSVWIDEPRTGHVHKSRWISHLLGCGLVAVFFTALLSTKSRSAWLAALVCLIAACFLHPAIRRGGWLVASRFRAMAIAIALLSVFAIGFVLIRDPLIVAEAGKSLSYRLDYWRGAVGLIQAEPWNGYGVANFQQNYNRLKSVTASESPADPHNFLLETATAGGLPLLVILIAILAIFVWRTFDVARYRLAPTTPFGLASHNKVHVQWAILVGGLVSFFGMLLFESMVGDGDTMLPSILFAGFAILVGLLLVQCNWLADDQHVAAASMIAAIAILVHLLASGGWMQPGVMNSLCVLVGVAFGTQVRGAVAERVMPIAKARSNPIFPIAGLMVIASCAVGFVKTMCLPVLAASNVKSMATSNANAVRDANDWLEIIQLDAHDPELASIAANQLVELLGNRNLSDSARKKYETVLDACCEAYLKRDANQWVAYAECGRWNAILADSETTGTTETEGAMSSRRTMSYQYFAKSAELYPNSAQTQLQAAVIAAWCKRTQEATQHWNRAAEIDRETPHADRKLAAVVVFFPKKLEAALGPLEVQAKVAQPGYAKGEPILQWLRTNVR